MRVVKFPEFKKSPDRIFDEAIADASFIIIKRRKAGDAVVMSASTFHGLMETIHLLRSPANAAHLAEAIEQYRNGKTLP